ncbi:hypothetical protein ADIAG_02921 [Paeniglutamicibacter gangotriensis Lz1y]|uniref:Uncharacterized protein n=1 Tax=Paeniglutamicibacter gangotriensis Lz1y TaxID=1276920 RepID=M7MR65_9MICC|nr:hypothetical protein ADIAG_02921 [Paeniglutamicibacter gangotriensis Lz1y]
MKLPLIGADNRGSGLLPASAPTAADDFGFLFLLTASEALLAPPRSATSLTAV